MGNGKRALRIGAVIGSIVLAASFVWWRTSATNRPAPPPPEQEPVHIDAPSPATQPAPPFEVMGGSKSMIFTQDSDAILPGSRPASRPAGSLSVRH